MFFCLKVAMDRERVMGRPEEISLHSRLLFILVRGRRESLSSRTTSVRDSSAGSCFVNRFMCPGNHDGADGSAGNDMTGIILS